MRILLFTILFYAFCIIEVKAEDYSGFGEYRFGPNVTETKACALALENAKKNSLTKVYGEKIFSEDLMRCTETDDDVQCELNKSTISAITGTIKKIKSKKRSLERQEGYSICRFEIVVDIVKPKQKKDPNFDFNISINNKLFRNGEELTILIEPNATMFINIFQWQPYTSTGISLTKIFPNINESNNKIEKNKKKKIPGESSEVHKKYNFVVEYPNKENKKYVDEYLVVVATKNIVNFVTDYDFKSFQDIISEIPNNEYRTKKMSYEILKN